MWIDIVIPHDLPCDASNERRLTVVAGLVARSEPVPTLRGIGRLRLLRVDDETSATFGGEIHSRACRKIISRLRAPMQHDDQGARSGALAAGDVELVRPATAGIRERAADVTTDGRGDFGWLQRAFAAKLRKL